MKFHHTILGALLFLCLASSAFAAEFPGSEDKEKVVNILAAGKVIAELKLLTPAIIDAKGSNITVAPGPGGKLQMNIKDGSIEIRPHKGRPMLLQGELIVVHGYAKN